MIEETVLVTGGTGFIAQHCILALLRGGYRVRATVRSLAREDEVRANLREGGIDAGERLSFVVANLEQDQGWAEAVGGCRYVLHGASPTPTGLHANEDDWVRPAVEGNLRVLRAARDAGVRRVVLTSAFGAICAGHGEIGRPFDENDWSDLSASDVWLYQKSKTLSERAAWDFIAREGQGLELSVVNPVAVLGPVLGPDYSHSIRLIRNLLAGQPGSPKINCGFVDARDVADLHLLAMTHAAARGERFIATAGDSLWLGEVARLLKERMGPVAAKVSTRVLPNWVVRLGALKDPALKGSVPLLGRTLNSTSAKARRLLGWSPRPAEEAIVATARSLDRLGLLAN
ncbi:nucleoside-diphosphate-sugar epimerase [Pseudomonas nitritireducens]|uniref:Nucleoside-diphosphate-sugar epimerase n=1 Tax=Pseudomonas nitroreducens TaxID=46680 RepID=A0A7W7KMV3_PSENT|nr:aldehyde reductase [Pseudomonas nitritireducens]MBB4865735.1 nucleoside-diphosphate-sugar epimerase [Pseudomonas nitritireducens]